MIDIIHRVGIKAPVAKVYEALATTEGVAAWWARETTGVSRPGGNLDIRFFNPRGELLGAVNMDVIALDPNQEVRWRIRSGPAEWIGTDVVFELSQAGEYTIVLFGHKNWREAVEFTAHCSMKWATFMLSLKELVETGSGRPSPHDLKVDERN